MSLKVYLAGEIHTQWRNEIQNASEERGLDILFYSAVTDHDRSDAAGDSLGVEASNFWRDHKASKINAIRNTILLKKSDLVVVRFGDKYKQWNAAFDAGYCAALGKPYITLHSEELVHPLKEVDASAMAWTTTTEQVVEILRYTLSREAGF